MPSILNISIRGEVVLLTQSVTTRTSPAGVYPMHTCYCCHLASSALLINPNYALFLFVGLPTILLAGGIRVVPHQSVLRFGTLLQPT